MFVRRNSTLAEMVEEHHPVLTFVAASPTDMDEPSVAFQEFLASVLYVLLNTQTQIVSSC